MSEQTPPEIDYLRRNSRADETDERVVYLQQAERAVLAAVERVRREQEADPNMIHPIARKREAERLVRGTGYVVRKAGSKTSVRLAGMLSYSEGVRRRLLAALADATGESEVALCRVYGGDPENADLDLRALKERWQGEAVERRTRDIVAALRGERRTWERTPDAADPGAPMFGWAAQFIERSFPAGGS